jgi:hypothetical protein
MTEKLTVFDIMEILEAAPREEKETVLTRLLEEYDGDDKDLIEPDLWSSVALTSDIQAL